MKRFAAGTVLGLVVGVMFTAFIAAFEAIKWLHDKEEDELLLNDARSEQSSLDGRGFSESGASIGIALSAIPTTGLHIVPGVEQVRQPVRTLP